MSLKKFSLSFLKEHRIRYFIEDDNVTAVYECLICGEKGIINLETTKWDCRHCEKNGDIEMLMNIRESLLVQEKPLGKKQFYNPRKKKNEVNHHLKQLVLKSKGTEIEKELLKIQIKIARLLEELLEKKTKSTIVGSSADTNSQN